MYDYMRALRQRFDTPPQCEAFNRELNRVHDELHGRLDKQDRKLLLRLINLENAIRDETSLRSFTNGYRLAIGINRELSDRPPYSFDKEEEEHARVLNEEEHPM
ncbi:hypothetical protein OBV_04550 [Oscillibacter valericigenes Sjm18-20]|nr:hypothetical protein OBV_04550 [Oscillibacter valericigenes Sjm18-20]